MAADRYLVIKLVNDTSIENSFILNPYKDPAAVKALQAYAAATENKVLANDLYAWVGKPKEQQTLEQVILERDHLMKLVHDVIGCPECVHEEKPLDNPICKACGVLGKNWVWRGLPDEKGSA